MNQIKTSLPITAEQRSGLGMMTLMMNAEDLSITKSRPSEIPDDWSQIQGQHFKSA